MKPAEKAFHEDIQLIIKYSHACNPSVKGWVKLSDDNSEDKEGAEE